MTKCNLMSIAKLSAALMLLTVTAACTQASPEAWEGGSYNAVPLPASKVAAMGPSAGIF